MQGRGVFGLCDATAGNWGAPVFFPKPVAMVEQVLPTTDETLTLMDNPLMTLGIHDD